MPVGEGFSFFVIICAAHLVSITGGVIPSFSLASAQIVQFDDPILTVSTEAGRKNLTETYTRIAIADPGKPINGVYINSNATNPTLDFKVGETVEVSGIAPEYFSGLMLKVLPSQWKCNKNTPKQRILRY